MIRILSSSFLLALAILIGCAAPVFALGPSRLTLYLQYASHFATLHAR